jgi:hypothetical protein
MIQYSRIASFTKHTSLGEPFTVYRELPLMPRINNRFLDCSVYLYPTRADAECGERIGGTGFLVAVRGFGDGWMLDVPCPRNDIFHLYAVTVRHLIRHHK